MRSFRAPAVASALALCFSLAVGFSAGAAQAASAGPAASGRQASTSPAEVVTEGTPGTSVVPASDDSAGDPCTTDTYTRYLIDEATQQEVAAFAMHTYFCWNNKTVTSHTTWETGSVTTLGGLEGWTYLGHDATVFHCYTAYGSSRTCSGNYEEDQGNFQECILHYGCVGSWNPTIQMWENYKGKWYYSN